MSVVMQLAAVHAQDHQGGFRGFNPNRGIVGQSVLAISFGSAGQTELRDGDTLQSEPPLQMADLLKKTSGHT